MSLGISSTLTVAVVADFAVVGVPEMMPDVGLIVMPAGSPVAENV